MATKLSEWRLKLTDGVGAKIEKIRKMADKTNFTMDKLNSSFKGLGTNIKNAAQEIPGLSTAFDLLTNPIALVGALGVGFATLTTQMHQDTENLAQQQSKLQFMFGETGLELQKFTADTVSASKVLQVSEEELIRSAKALESNFDELRGNGRGALDLVVKGLQQTNGLLDLNEIKEYAVQMRSVGLNAQNTIAIATQSIQQGLWSDKGLDAIKEGGLRLREMTPAAQAALNGIGLSSTAMLKAMDEGSLSTFEAIQMVSKALQGANTQARQTAIADLFGGAGEDAGLQFLLSLQGINLEMQNLANNQNPIIDAQNQRMEMERQIAMQQLEFAPILNEMWLNMELIFLRIKQAVVGVFGWIIDNGSLITDIIESVGIAVGILGGAWLVLNANLILATVSQWALNAAMAANPILLVVGLIAGLIASIVMLWKRSEGFRGALYGMWESIKEVFSGIKSIFMEIFGGISDVIMGIFSGDWDKVKAGFKSLGKGIISANPVGIYVRHGEKIGGAFAKGFDEGVEDVRAGKEEGLFGMGMPTMPTAMPTTGIPNGFESLTGNATPTNFVEKNNTSTNKINPTSAGITAVNGGGKSVKNVTVNINKLVEQLIVKAENVKDSTSDIKRLVEEALIKAIQGGEIAVSND